MVFDSALKTVSVKDLYDYAVSISDVTMTCIYIIFITCIVVDNDE